ncbi:UNVERIFIED_CONTAM: putative pectate lyase 1 [Sesamum radiatum]|uniref:Pectate lyase 1 n=1 Tax=Sesamum radiatum TaxID=300843 RepID=A0AAW2LNY7_SESRA
MFVRVRRSIKNSTDQLGRGSCRTGNPIDDCWRCDPDWEANRKVLADCGIGFGRNAIGGRDGEFYVVTSEDDDPRTQARACLDMPSSKMYPYGSSLIMT